jgi:hypothetical protein
MLNNNMAIPNNTVACPLPDNITPLSPNGFNFTITKIPNISFFCQQANLPGITFGDPMFANPFASVPIPGDHLTYDTLSIQFLVDSGMKNYQSIYNWMIALGFPQAYEQYINFKASDTTAFSLNELANNYSDALLQILGGNNNPVQTIQFVDIFPIAIESVLFQSTNTDVPYIVGNATFRYSYYKFI